MRSQQRFGGYAVTAKIGEGGMGEVYRARDTKLDRDGGVESVLYFAQCCWFQTLTDLVPMP